MKYGYLMYRSVTFAQSAQRTLRDAGISAAVSKAPKVLTSDGCAYILRFEGSKLYTAIDEMKRVGNVPQKAFTGNGMGEFTQI